VEKCRGYIGRLRELGENNANSGDDDEDEPEAQPRSPPLARLNAELDGRLPCWPKTSDLLEMTVNDGAA